MSRKEDQDQQIEDLGLGVLPLLELVVTKTVDLVVLRCLRQPSSGRQNLSLDWSHQEEDRPNKQRGGHMWSQSQRAAKGKQRSGGPCPESLYRQVQGHSVPLFTNATSQ